MKLTKKIGTLASVALVAGSVIAPAQAGAQTTQLCGGQPVTIMGTSGNDIIQGTDGNDVIFAAQGNDHIEGFGGDDIICAGKGDDVVIGGQGFDILYGAQGDDVLFAANGSVAIDREDTRGARMFGGAGDDLIVGSSRWDRMQGGLGVDHLYGYEGRDWLRGGADTDYIDGGAGIDDAHGGSGHDRFRATTGDTVRGSSGNDLCAVLGNPEQVISCAASNNAFDTARHMPITPMTHQGALQTIAHQAKLINERETAKYFDVFGARCPTDTEGLQAGYDLYDEFFGPGWTMSIELNGWYGNEFDGIMDGDIHFRVFSSNGELVFEGLDDITLIYEDGAWRINECG